MSACIVIPVYKNVDASDPFELISLKQCLRVLKNQTFFLIGPASINWESYGAIFKQYNVTLNIKTFSAKYFIDVGGYSRLLLSRLFYRSFSEFDYILIYQTDAFVFRDELQKWCETDLDFIGAPWFEKFSSENTNAAFAGIGNGGFSLRKVKSHLKVLNSFSYISAPQMNWYKRMKDNPKGLLWIKLALGFVLDLFIRNNTFWLMNSYQGFEDQFWGLVAAKNFPWFKMPSSAEAMKFGFEMQPRKLYVLNGEQLPFGCHAWWKYDFEFWKPHIEALGYELKLPVEAAKATGLSKGR